MAADATAEAFVRAYERWDRVRAMESPGGWLYRVALNVVRRRAGRRRGVQAATAVVALAVPAWLVVQRDPGVDTTTGPADTAWPSPTTTTTPARTSATAATTTTTAPSADLGPDAPWAGPPLPASAAPARGPHALGA